jgi:hypothetical protein
MENILLFLWINYLGSVLLIRTILPNNTKFMFTLKNGFEDFNSDG